VDKEINNILLKYDYALEILKVEISYLIKEYELKHNYNPVEHIKTRIKTIDSITNKLNKKGYELNLENIQKYIHDVIGIRIICSFLSDVYDIVNLIKNFKHIIVVEEKNYIINPKNSGYTSYHLIIKMPIYLNNSIEHIEAEIQIRTVAMDFWASLDHKIQYKFSSFIPEEVKKEMYNYAVDIKNLDCKMLELNKMMTKYKE